MKPSEFIDENELYRKAMLLLYENLGPVEASRFLSVVKSKRMDSVKRHRQWQEGLDKDQFFKDILQENASITPYK
ncbi:MAG: hypothetical protein KA747_09680 [Ignavibacteriaceae bacterium]|jgi:hypothetical protein|nr:hypothetical protein [Ignavibacteriaceae bacterium]